MNLLAGLEKFGLSAEEDLDILAESKKKKAAPEPKKVKKVEQISERDFLMTKTITCAVCDQTFDVRAVIGSKVKRLEPDSDLRPNHAYIDTLKYGVYACPHCGYAGLTRDFEHISSAQRKWIKESICKNFKPSDEPKVEVYTYDYAVDKYKLALVSSMAKKAKLSEKSYICLNIAWLRRKQYEILPDDTSFYQQKRQAVKEEMDGFYKQAYDGFTKALATEIPPFYGMDASTVEYILAQMSFYFGKLDVASKLVSKLLTGGSSSKKIKDNSLELKYAIIAQLQAQNGKKKDGLVTEAK